MNPAAVVILALVLIIGVVAFLLRAGNPAPNAETHAAIDEAVAVPLAKEEAAIAAEHRRQDRLMTHDQILERARNDLQVKTAAHSGAWKLGDEERWDFDGDKGTLTFTFPRVIVQTRAQLVGTYVYSRKSWLWGWANRSMADLAKADVEIVRKHLVERQVPKCDEPELFVEEADAWEFTSLTCYLANAQGGYSGRDGDMRAFFTFHDVEIKPRS